VIEQNAHQVSDLRMMIRDVVENLALVEFWIKWFNVAVPAKE
jgi:hypothetical protein